MNNQTEISREILYQFLEKWTIDNVRKMTLEEYVSVDNPETFCQWVETKTEYLGNIKGPARSIKFGIYKRKDTTKKPKNYNNDAEYSWQKSFNANTRRDAFNIVKDEIIRIIDCANVGSFEAIDNSPLYSIFKWKVAFLYSQERIIPIFKHEWMLKIANQFNLQTEHYSKIYEAMISDKPAHLSVFQYAAKFWRKFGDEKEAVSENEAKRGKRRAVAQKNTKTQTRGGALPYIATQKHNLLQEALKRKLVGQYGEKNVLMEEDNVDIKVIQRDKIYFYEVKSAGWAGDCVKEALGQILLYTHRDNDGRPKHLIVAGQYEPNADELKYINYLKQNLALNFDYEKIYFVSEHET
jgi:hypothetical protein